MPEFNEFIKAVGTMKPTKEIKVNDILKAQARPGSSDKNEGRIKDIAEMFVSAEKQIDDEMKTFGNKEVLKELIKIDKKFANYANNLSDMAFSIGKFSNENTEVSKEDAEKLQILVKENEAITNAINNQRKQDKDYNERILEKERQNDFHLRTQGVMAVEQARVQSKNNISSEDLWKTVAENIDTLKDEVKVNLKDTLIEGFGGPLGSMVKKVFIPGFKAIKDSAVGEYLGPKLEGLGTKIKSMFIKTTSNEGKLGEENKIINELQDVNDELKLDLPNIEDKVVSQGEESNSKIKRVFSEDHKQALKDAWKKRNLDKKTQEKLQNTGIFRKIHEENVQSNLYLKDIVMLLKDEKRSVSDSLQLVAESQAIITELSTKSEEEQTKILNSNDAQIKLLDKIHNAEDIQIKKEEYLKDFSDNFLIYQKAQDVESDDDRTENLEMQTKIWKELKDLDVSGGEGGIGTGLELGITSAIGKALAGLSPYLGIAMGAALAGLAIWKTLDSFLERSKKEEEEKTKTAQASSNIQKGSIENLKQLQPQLFTKDEFGNERLNKEELIKFVANRESSIKAGTDKEQGYQYLNGLIPTSSEDSYMESKTKDKGVSAYKIQMAEEGMLNAKLEGKSLDEKTKATELFRKQAGYSKPLTPNEEIVRRRREQWKLANPGKPTPWKEEQTEIDVKPTSYVKANVQQDSDQSVEEIRKVEKERSTIKAERKQKKIENKQTQKSGTGPIAMSTGKKQKNLDEISLLPMDNFGITLINSGLNIV